MSPVQVSAGMSEEYIVICNTSFRFAEIVCILAKSNPGNMYRGVPFRGSIYNVGMIL